MRAHGDLVRSIEQLGHDGNVTVTLGEPCSGKGDLVIYYPSQDVRRKIEAIIGAETFYGVPYRLVNV